MVPTKSLLLDADDHLAMVFSHFYCVQQATDAPVLPQQLVPNYEMLLVFNFGPAIPMWLGDKALVFHRTVVLGPLRHLLRYELPPGADVIVVNFTLNGFYRLVGRSAQQVRAADWRDADWMLDPMTFESLWQELTQKRTQTERLEWIRSYIQTYLAPVRQQDHDLFDSIPLFGQNVVDPVKAMAEDQRVSSRSIQLQFQTNLGYSAKELARFLRFKQVLVFLIQHAANAIDWLSVVDRFRYYDQSHLIQDFRFYLGMTPRQFVKQVNEKGICISKSGKFY